MHKKIDISKVQQHADKQTLKALLDEYKDTKVGDLIQTVTLFTLANIALKSRGVKSRWARFAVGTVLNDAWAYLDDPEGYKARYKRLAAIRQERRELLEQNDVGLGDEPHFVVEVMRYDEPEMKFRFFHFEPAKLDPLKISHRPFAHREDGVTYVGPLYHEVKKEQVGVHEAIDIADDLRDQGYKMRNFHELDVEFAHWIAHTVCPIEFHKGLDEYDEKVTRRVKIWIKDR